MTKQLISIIIPTLNEEKNISKLLPKIPVILNDLKNTDYEIIIVDGESSDKTVEIAKSFGGKIVYDHKGKGSALRKGFEKANGDILISMDADLSNDPKELKLIIDSINIGYDISMGSRFITGGGTDDMPILRKIGNRFFVFLVNIFFKSNYSDLCYGYRGFRKNVIKKLNLKEDRFAIETEISIKAAKKHLKVIEIPSVEKKRSSGSGKLRTFYDGYNILKTILKNIFISR
ncbi:MAG: glycosyltransferase family 2 protein [Candidatus Micrarchaeia archaeon]